MLSVIVPAHNARGELEQCLSALAHSTYKNFEVIVVDDASTESRQALLPDDRFDVGADTGTPVDEEDDLVPAPPDRETRRVGSYSA